MLQSVAERIRRNNYRLKTTCRASLDGLTDSPAGRRVLTTADSLPALPLAILTTVKFCSYRVFRPAIRPAGLPFPGSEIRTVG